MTGSRVSLTFDAERDLHEIVDFVGRKDGVGRAEPVVDRLVVAMESLVELPDRGSVPQELLTVGVREFRQVFFKPYRIIYRPVGRDIIVYLIADGRRDFQTLLARRLLTR